MTAHPVPAEQTGGYPLVMPKLGLTMTEATLVEWLRADGDLVEKGAPLFVLESDKSVLQIEAPVSGTLQILITAGETVPVHTPIALLLGTERAGAPAPTRTAAPGLAAAAAARGSTRRGGSRVPASPKARALARRLGVSLHGISGTGARGMVVAVDVRRASAAVKASPVARRWADHAGLDLSRIVGSGPRGQILRQDVEAALAPQPAASPPPGRLATPLTGLRAIIAERLSASWRERPHVTLTLEADATQLISARQQATAESGVKIAYDAFLVALVARALREHPHLNVRLTERGIETVDQVNVGVAVDTQRGLLVPVVRDAGSKGLLQIQRDLAELVERAQAGRSLPDDLTGGSFTITNLGMFEIDAFTPIINPPESAILGVGRIAAKPVAVDRQVVVRDMVSLSLSFDHRLIDGAPAARFLQRLKQLVERPFALALGQVEARQGL